MVLVPAKKLFANGVFDLIEISILSRLKMNKKLLIHKKSFLNFCPLFISHQIVGRISMTHNGLARMFVSKFEDKIFSITKGLIKKSDFEVRLDTL